MVQLISGLSEIASLLIEEQQLMYAEAIAYENEANALNMSLIHYLVQERNYSAREIAQVLSKALHIPFYDLSTCVVETLPMNFIQTSWMHRHIVLPLRQQGEELLIAIEDPTQKEMLRTIQFHTEFQVVFVVAESDQLRIWRKKYLDSTWKLKDSRQEFSVEDFMKNLFAEAIQKKASDIHFEPYENFYRVRFRVDGLLYEITTAPLSMLDRITAYLKVMANLDTAERRLPQDGRFQLTNIDCRISTCPTVNGEKVVLRLLHRARMERNMDSLGFNEQQKNIFLNALKQPQGIIFVTGPTGSGKTITLYTALDYLNCAEKNICSVEEPVEIKLPGINQVGVNLKAGLTFSKVARTFLRQDPDVMMIGEIRDLETAQIAVSAAQTGHLVLSTLHANGAVETLARMAHMGIPAFQIVDSIQLIIAQRLVRKVCECCHAPGVGCQHCHDGYRGRVGIFELLPMSSELSDQIAKGVPIQSDMMTLQASGLEKVSQNLTTLEEVQRVIGF